MICYLGFSIDFSQLLMKTLSAMIILLLVELQMLLHQVDLPHDLIMKGGWAEVTQLVLLRVLAQ